MKKIAWLACAAVVGLALIAGKDDIRRFLELHRMSEHHRAGH
jgi:hypothetical protein